MNIYKGVLINAIPLKNKLKLKQLKHASRFVTHNSLLTIHYSLPGLRAPRAVRWQRHWHTSPR